MQHPSLEVLPTPGCGVHRDEQLGKAYSNLLQYLRANGRAAPGLKVSDAAHNYTQHPTSNALRCRTDLLRGFNFMRFVQRSRTTSAPAPAAVSAYAAAPPAAPVSAPRAPDAHQAHASPEAAAPYAQQSARSTPPARPQQPPAHAQAQPHGAPQPDAVPQQAQAHAQSRMHAEAAASRHAQDAPPAESKAKPFGWLRGRNRHSPPGHSGAPSAAPGAAQNKNFNDVDGTLNASGMDELRATHATQVALQCDGGQHAAPAGTASIGGIPKHAPPRLQPQLQQQHQHYQQQVSAMQQAQQQTQPAGVSTTQQRQQGGRSSHIALMATINEPARDTDDGASRDAALPAPHQAPGSTSLQGQAGNILNAVHMNGTSARSASAGKRSASGKPASPSKTAHAARQQPVSNDSAGASNVRAPTTTSPSQNAGDSPESGESTRSSRIIADLVGHATEQANKLADVVDKARYALLLWFQVDGGKLLRAERIQLFNSLCALL